MEKLNKLKMFFLEHKYYFIGGFLFFLLILGICIFIILHQDNHQEETSKLENIKIEKETMNSVKEEYMEEICQVMVDVKGEVNNPGLYLVDCNARVLNAIDAAGGVKDSADTSILNLGKKVKDEMVIIIYSKEQVSNFITTKEEENKKQELCQNQVIQNDACISKEEKLDDSTNQGITNESENNELSDTPVNSMVSLNHATKEELMTLPGIGESKAEIIISYREENGGFQSIEELKNVKGIGEKIFDKIKDNIML